MGTDVREVDGLHPQPPAQPRPELGQPRPQQRPLRLRRHAGGIDAGECDAPQDERVHRRREVVTAGHPDRGHGAARQHRFEHAREHRTANWIDHGPPAAPGERFRRGVLDLGGGHDAGGT
jgi:hypothetical protein